MSEEARRLQAQDWLDDLREFPPAVVDGACQRWRRQPGGKRPTPGDIRQFCIDEQRDYPRYYGADNEALPDISAEERYARQAGWASAVERRDAILQSRARIERGLTWQQENAAELRDARPKTGFRSLGEALGAVAQEEGLR